VLPLKTGGGFAIALGDGHRRRGERVVAEEMGYARIEFIGSIWIHLDPDGSDFVTWSG
jgi:hypothetical protein